MKTLKELCIELEHYETPQWAVDAILKKEIMTLDVYDPCTGTGILAEVAQKNGYDVITGDIHDWGYKLDHHEDFLEREIGFQGTIFMNPPFTLAHRFVEQSFDLGARKVVCFQRYAWYESQDRKQFWDKYPPNRIWVCADRATCWRHDLPIDDKGRRYNPETGKELAGTSTAHAWFVWEPLLMPGTLSGRLYKEQKISSQRKLS